MSSIRSVLVSGLLAASMFGCARNHRIYQESSGGEVASDNVTVQVRNDNWSDVNVYAVMGGVARRLGTVPGNSHATFSLRASQLPTGQVRLIADPIGGTGNASSGTLAVTGGDVVDFTIAPVLSQSSASVH